MWHLMWRIDVAVIVFFRYRPVGPLLSKDRLAGELGGFAARLWHASYECAGRWREVFIAIAVLDMGLSHVPIASVWTAR